VEYLSVVLDRIENKMKELLKDEIFKDMKKHRIKAIDGKKNTSYLHRKLKNMDINKLDWYSIYII
jgi:hypothetical protein